jgi:hypothetical protein
MSMIHPRLDRREEPESRRRRADRGYRCYPCGRRCTPSVSRSHSRGRRISGLPSRPPILRHDGPPPRSKRLLTAQDLTDIMHRYEAGETTQQIGERFSISKTRVASVLREQGIAIRRQGLSDTQRIEATTLYATAQIIGMVGRSLPRIPFESSHGLAPPGRETSPSSGPDLMPSAP